MAIITVIQHEDILFTIFAGATPVRTFDFEGKSYWDHEKTKKAADQNNTEAAKTEEAIQEEVKPATDNQEP